MTINHGRFTIGQQGTPTGRGALNGRICCFALSSWVLDHWLDNRSNLKMSPRSLRDCDEHISQSDISIKKKPNDSL